MPLSPPPCCCSEENKRKFVNNDLFQIQVRGPSGLGAFISLVVFPISFVVYTLLLIFRNNPVVSESAMIITKE